ncbi:hypothetical protein ACFU53_34560 [Streptomyces sp. NPDC057474]|uniref:hypothetical protein n=1 Tax=Streptomyces sp. NPDC057474 TaxID=3346144 RepID=UPI003695B60E
MYRLTFDDDGTAVAYVWSPDEDYEQHGGDGKDTDAPDPRHPLSHASGIELFTGAHARLGRLARLGVRIPRLLLADRTGRHLPADAAVVPDRHFMRAIAEHSIGRTLDILGTSSR